ncbi:hypothetical protein GCM10010502_69140 [Kitasatospora aureofaciens]|uniref:Reverse transcriptase domain-containing protein n=1 Tax=Kitasatospora aureofaciens TaxID=1894 RepID=A0A8H9I073_KITAU|nr:hypothetical protein GCM10010502_69140 [Kitasatospora aureofaciens]
MDKLKSPDKSFEISKWEVLEAYRQVKRNKGASGVDGQSIDDFEKDLQGNLYKIWNRMSSGTYFPPPVRAVEIPKQHGGGTRLAFPLSPTGWRRPLWPIIWESEWSLYSTKTPMDIGRTGPRSTRWNDAGDAAGRRTG